MDGITPQERKEAIDDLLAEWLDFEKELKTASGVLTNASTMTPEAIAKELSERESRIPTVREGDCSSKWFPYCR